MIRLTVPSIEADDLAAVREVLASGYLVQGSHVKRFEAAVAERAATSQAIAVSNCTAALHVALLAVGVQPGDLVVTSAYSFPATANAIELCGATPVFVDIEIESFNIDPEKLAPVLDELMRGDRRARVKAILPVHAFGHLADMARILAIAKPHGVPVIEDAACALGAVQTGRPAGGWATAGCFSFHPRKAVTTGEGGMVVTNDAALAARLRALRNHGIDSEAQTTDFILPGFNYRITDFQGAMGVSQLAKLDRIVAARRERAAIYDRMLSDGDFRPPVVKAGHEPVYQSYVALLPSEWAERRPRAIRALLERGVETTIGTWHVPMTRYYRERYGYKTGDFPVTDAVFARALTLPLHETLSIADQERVVSEIRGAFN